MKNCFVRQRNTIPTHSHAAENDATSDSNDEIGPQKIEKRLGGRWAVQKCSKFLDLKNPANLNVLFLIAKISFDTAENEPSKVWAIKVEVEGDVFIKTIAFTHYVQPNVLAIVPGRSWRELLLRRRLHTVGRDELRRDILLLQRAEVHEDLEGCSSST